MIRIVFVFLRKSVCHLTMWRMWWFTWCGINNNSRRIHGRLCTLRFRETGTIWMQHKPLLPTLTSCSTQLYTKILVSFIGAAATYRDYYIQHTKFSIKQERFTPNYPFKADIQIESTQIASPRARWCKLFQQDMDTQCTYTNMNRIMLEFKVVWMLCFRETECHKWMQQTLTPHSKLLYNWTIH